jgi:alkane 1-monooxygenase
MIWFLIITLVYLFKFYSHFGGKIFVLYLGSMAISLYIMESIEYIEHYGLFSCETKDGYFNGKMDGMCAWNAPHRFSNWYSFKIERHSDHHNNAYKEYQILNLNKEWPTLPEGYIHSALIAISNKYWLKSMNYVLEALY